MADKIEKQTKPGASWQRTLMKGYPILILAFVVILFGILSGGSIFTVRSLKNIAESSFQYLIGCMAALFIFAQGEQDFSLAANIALSAIIAVSVSSLGVPAVILVALLVSIVIGGLNGLLYARLPIPVFFLTMCIGNVITGFLGPLTKYQSVKAPASMLKWNNIYLKIVITIVFGILMWILYQKTEYGKCSRAIGASQVVTAESGININKYKFAAFVLTGISAGIIAFFSICKSGGASQATGTMFHFNVLVAMALGGATTGGPKVKFQCAVLGPLIISVLTLGMNLAQVPVGMQNLFKGVLFLGVMVLSDRLSKFDID